MRRVAVTGVSGYIGAQLVRRLSAHPGIEAIIGLDIRPPAEPPAKLTFLRHDITQPLDDLFAQQKVDSAVHLAFVVAPTRKEAWATKINIGGTRNFLQACASAGVGYALYLGSTAAYGAHADNPVPLMEERPLRPNKRFQYSRDKAATEGLFAGFAASHPQAKVAVLRGCPVMGPGGTKAIGAKVFQPVMVRIAGYDPPVQFIHEDDLIEIIVTMLERQLPGTYNVAGDGVVPYSQVAKMARRRMVAVPKGLIGGVMDVAWALRLQSQSNSAGLDFIAYPWVAGNEKLKQATGFRYRYSTEQTIEAFLRVAKKK
jgi:UDP-glucose 4-epimerase